VGTHEYDVDIKKLLQRRLEQAGQPVALSGDNGLVRIELSGEGALEGWCTAVCALLLRDLAHFEMARMVNDLPLSLEEKRSVLPEAVRLSRAMLQGEEDAPSAAQADVTHMLMAYYAEEDHLNLEGFMRFRLKEVLRDWELCVMQATEELLLQAEYNELMHVLSAFMQLAPPQIKDVYVVLNPDGSCILTDDKDSRIEYDPCTGDNVLNALAGLSPERITVYDLSGGRSAQLAEALIRMFEHRVRVFK
jgi:hypothetical protein